MNQPRDDQAPATLSDVRDQTAKLCRDVGALHLEVNRLTNVIGKFAAGRQLRPYKMHVMECADHVAAWTSGQNLPISPDQLSQALGSDQAQQMASAAGQPVEDFLKDLSDHLSNNGPAAASAS